MPVVVAYNPSLVAEQDVPKTWDALLDPKWKGKTSLLDPSQGISLDTVSTLLNAGEWSESDLQALAGNTPTVVPITSLPSAINNVANGQSAIAFPLPRTLVQNAIDTGAPIKVAFPLENNNFMTRIWVGKIESAPNPLTADLYYNWMLTKSGGDAVASYGLYSPVPGTNPPTGLPPLDDIKQAPALPFTDLLPTYEKNSPITKQRFGL